MLYPYCIARPVSWRRTGLGLTHQAQSGLGFKNNNDAEMNPQFVRLPDNRRLAFAEYGDPEGLPVVYCHGFPSSRREARLLHRTAGQEGFRIIAADRPGFGDSDFKAFRKISDWPDDVTRLADQLDLGSFGLLGISGGAPYALACAARVGTRLSGCTLVCPLGPVYESWALQAMPWAVRINFEAALYTPAFVRALYGGVTSSVLYHWPHLVETLARRTGQCIRGTAGYAQETK